MPEGLTDLSRKTSDSALSFEEVEYAAPTPDPVRRPLGRPSLIDDFTLRNRRDRLVQILESCWGEIGGAVRKIRKPDDLLKVFGVLEGKVWDDFISLFWTPSNQPPSNSALTKIRSELRRLAEPIQAASEAEHRAAESFQRARSALGQHPNRRERKLIRKEFVRRWRDSREKSGEYRRLRERDNHLHAQLKVVEAFFIRQEIFRFVKSKRYELNPMNLANAAAGLPFMGCRQSVRRCSKQNCVIANSTEYQVFKAIRFIVQNLRKKTAREAIKHFRLCIPRLPSRYRLARIHLAEHWLFLERALREVFSSNVLTKTLSFEITAKYQSQRRVQTHVDILLAERAKLNL